MHIRIVNGQALMALDYQKFRLSKGESADIPRGFVHRLENIGDENLVCVEVRQGDYFGEDDIERLEDDYGRV